MKSVKEIFKTRVASIIALAFVFAYLGIYYFKDPNAVPMETLHNIIMIIIGYFFGAANKEDKKRIKDEEDKKGDAE